MVLHLRKNLVFLPWDGFKGVFLLPFVFKKQMGCYLLLSEMASTINIVVLTKKAFSQFAVLFFSVEIPVLFP